MKLTLQTKLNAAKDHVDKKMTLKVEDLENK